jgi:hypothetical protein
MTDALKLSGVLVALAGRAGVAIDQAAAARLTPILASVLSDWSVLAHGAGPRVEPMSIGRWPEGRRDHD